MPFQPVQTLNLAQIAETAEQGRAADADRAEQRGMQRMNFQLQLSNAARQAKKDQIEQARMAAERVAAGVAGADSPEAWDTAIGELAAEFPQVAAYKGRYSPGLKTFVINQALQVNEILKAQEEQFQAAAPGSAIYSRKTGELRATVPAREDQTLVPVFDPASPTGTRLVSRAQAAGQPGPSRPGLDIQFGADGRPISIRQGGTGAPGNAGLAAPTVNRVEEQIVNNAQRMERLNEIQASFDPEFLTYLGQGQSWLAAVREKATGRLPADQRQRLERYTEFRSRAFNDLTATLKEMSGAAVTPQEAERLLRVIGDPSSDSPTEFNAKLKTVMRGIKLAQARLFHIRSQGLDPAKLGGLSLDDIEGVMKRRADQLYNEAQAANPQADDNSIAGMVRPRLAQEFGIRL